MVRGKVEMKRIENSTSRQVTFSKRRTGLLKKAYELSVLCDAEVALIIFSQRGRLFEFASSNMQKTIERYRERARETTVDNSTELKQYMEHLKHETANMAKKIEILEVSKRKLMGQGLGSCSMDELQDIDSQLDRSLKNIRARKAQLFKDEIERLKARERLLLQQNASLREKVPLSDICYVINTMPIPLAPPPTSPAQLKERGNCSQSTQSWEVETELFIGLPEMCCS
ncbi:hypothetical protein RND71_030109 [Anisodus tanguticus]|uniref:Agamous-like MADS-box protein AGL8 homolog n=1 Tax=Anisodus tanguticus TaxID=243964 RepID=A0AAE1RGU1_9SOLA|nr:hypothetical protein RND71_030109 [Anisodus tanguticus]